MELVRAGLDLHIHRCSAGCSLLGVKRIGHDVYGFNGICRRHVGDVLRQPRIGVLSTIDPRIVSLDGLPVDIALIARCGFPAAEFASIGNPKPGKIGMYVCTVCLQFGWCAGDSHSLGRFAHSKRRIDAPHYVCIHTNIVGHVRGKIRDRYCHLISSRLQIRKQKHSASICRDLASYTRQDICGFDPRAGDGGPGWIRHISSD